MTLIAPSILSADFARLGEEIKNAEAAGADWIHIDVMDGHFVPNITIGPLVVDAVRKITSLPLDVHLMIERPDDYIDAFAKAGSDRITVHAEVCPHLHRTLHHIRSAGALPGVSINPSTPVSMLEDIIEDTDMVLIMSVNPGFGGQSFIPQSLGRLRKLRALINSAAGGRNVIIEIDGGVTADNAREVADAGADVLVMGSAFFGAPDRFEVMRKLDAILERQQ